jgi:hypothetical protein
MVGIAWFRGSLVQDDWGQHPSSSYTFCHHEVRLIWIERAREAVPRDDIGHEQGGTRVGRPSAGHSPIAFRQPARTCPATTTLAVR